MANTNKTTTIKEMEKVIKQYCPTYVRGKKRTANDIRKLYQDWLKLKEVANENQNN